jgi:hypothetical protein
MPQALTAIQIPVAIKIQITNVHDLCPFLHHNLTLKLGEVASCDPCAKFQCCADVLASTNRAARAPLQECREPCYQQAFLRIVTSQETHPEGSDELGKVSTCARSKCTRECPTNVPDADDFGDSGH